MKHVSPAGGHSHICSDFVALHLTTPAGGREEMNAMLEEISSSGACILLDKPLAAGTRVRIACNGCGQTCEFSGMVDSCSFRDGLGHFALISFDPGSSWSPDRYIPQHLVDLENLAAALGDAEPPVRPCCGRSTCPNMVVARVVAPDLPLDERVRDVAREVAMVCGVMDGNEARECFHALFRIPAECCLFDRFQEAYTERREQIEAGAITPAALLDHVENVAKAINSIPREVVR